MRKLAIFAGVAAVVLSIGVAKFGSVYNQGVAYETSLTAQYLKTQNELSSYISGFYEQFNVAEEKSGKLKEILVDAVKGRYDGKAGGSMITMIKEAYPDLSGLNTFDKIQDYIVAGRQSYKQEQNHLLEMLQGYDRFRNEGLLMHFVKGFMFPSSRLEARIGRSVTRGIDARDQMYFIVLTSDAKKAYEDGKLDPLKLPTGAQVGQAPAAATSSGK